MTDNVIDYTAIRARLDAATPGPWAGFEDEASGERYLGLFYDGGNVQPITQWTGDQEDAVFIAHSRTDLEQLLDRVEELEATERKEAQPVRDQLDLKPNNLALSEATIPVAALDGIRAIAKRWLAKRLEEGIAGTQYARALEHCADELYAAIDLAAAPAVGEEGQ